jgi:hypothetical protein
MTTIVVITPAMLDALTTAIDRLDSEEHRYVERFTTCLNGCEFTVAQDPPRRTAGPEDCDECDYGTVEDEDAAHFTPVIDQLRALRGALTGE